MFVFLFVAWLFGSLLSLAAFLAMPFVSPEQQSLGTEELPVLEESLPEPVAMGILVPAKVK